ncbi:general substrate transporter [Dactylonectria macrodidyma]|uniref:General substrate transporter n=1 Tax=Dactylonectria macrodidyma TaxID=307937 RepID=A0A9P9ISM5_9HYPO|nr:general substrate transporter [Dactylonectria macrodidyma]
MVANDEEKLPLGKAIRKYPKVIGYCLGLTVVVVGWGYDLVVVGSITAVESFQEDYGARYKGELIIPSLWLSLWLAATPMGMAIGSLFAGWFQDTLGRKLSLMVGSIISAVGAVIIFCSYLPPDIGMRRILFTVGKVIQGFSVGILKVTAMTYISETAPTALRGSVMALIPTGNLTGQLIGSIVVYLVNDVEGNTGYLSAFGSQFIFAVAPFVLSIFMPESPAYLEERGSPDKAIKAAERLYAPRVDHLAALEKIRENIAEEKALVANASFASCFKGTHARRTWIVLMANLFPAMFGLDLLAKSSYFLQTLGMKSSLSLMILIGGIVAGIVANGIGIWIMSRAGRRVTSITSMIGAAVLWAAIGVSGFWRGAVPQYFTAGTMIAIIMVCGMGCWPAGYAIMGETSSLRLRAKTQALGGVAQQGSSVLMSFVLPYTFNTDAGNLGGKTGFIFVGLCLIAIGICFFCLPEMKGRSVTDIDHMFTLKLPARAFKKWRSE